jgi:hypothetical protein
MSELMEIIYYDATWDEIIIALTTERLRASLREDEVTVILEVNYGFIE